MSHVTSALPQYLPSPPINSFHVGPLHIRCYALGYIIGITLAILITRRRWHALGGDPDLVNDIALWVVPAGIIGGRIYFDLTTPADIPHVWYGVFAVWTGDLALAAFLAWLGRRAAIRPWGLVALYAAGYSAFRIFEESLRIDSSEHFLGLRLNMYIAMALTLAGLIWFTIAQHRPDRPVAVSPVLPGSVAGEAAAGEGDPESTKRDSVTTARSDE